MLLNAGKMTETVVEVVVLVEIGEEEVARQVEEEDLMADSVVIVDVQTEEASEINVVVVVVVVVVMVTEVAHLETKEVAPGVVTEMIGLQEVRTEVMIEEVMEEALIDVMDNKAMIDVETVKVTPILEVVPEEIQIVNLQLKNFVNLIQKKQQLVLDFSFFRVQWVQPLFQKQAEAAGPVSLEELVPEKKCSNPGRQTRIVLKQSEEKK